MTALSREGYDSEPLRSRQTKLSRTEPRVVSGLFIQQLELEGLAVELFTVLKIVKVKLDADKPRVEPLFGLHADLPGKFIVHTRVWCSCGVLTASLLACDPRIDALVEHFERQCARIEHLVMECTQVELVAKSSLRLGALGENG